MQLFYYGQAHCHMPRFNGRRRGMPRGHLSTLSISPPALSRRHPVTFVYITTLFLPFDCAPRHLQKSILALVIFFFFFFFGMLSGSGSVLSSLALLPQSGSVRRPI